MKNTVEFMAISVADGSLRVAVSGQGPLLVMVHGWPESWYSWRHQIDPLVSAGFKVAVPDVRGYGGSVKSASVAAYDMITLTSDVVAVIDGLGYDSAILIGHDWGAPICWHTALLHPHKVKAVAGLSVPYVPRGQIPPTARLKAAYTDKQRFFYQIYFQIPHIPEAELEADLADTLRKIYYMFSGDVTVDDLREIAAKPATARFLDGMKNPAVFPAWLSEDDINYYIKEFQVSGFRGPLNRYRNIDRDFDTLPQLAGAKIVQPAMFLAGERDPVLKFFPVNDVFAFIRPFYDDLRINQMIPRMGHWLQQEAPAQVNEYLLQFLNELRR